MRLPFVIATLVYAGALALWLAIDPMRENVIAVLSQARFAGLSVATVAHVLLRLLLIGGLFAPAGVLPALAIGGPASGRRGWLRVWLPAFATAMVIAVLIRGNGGDGTWSRPGPLDLMLPALGAATGASIGCALHTGVAGVARLAARLAVLAAVLLGSGIAAGSLALSKTPLAHSPMHVDSTEKRAIFHELQAHNPFKLQPGELTTLAMDPARLQTMLTLALQLLGGDARTRVAADGDRLEFAAGLHVAGARYLNVHGVLAAEYADGRLAVGHCALTVGALAVPTALCRASAHALLFALRNDRTLSAVVGPIARVHLGARGLVATYGQIVLQDDLHSALRGLLGPGEAVRLAVAAQYARLLPRLAGARGDDGFLELLRSAFALADERSRSGDPAAENQGAILALGALIGHRGVARAAAIDPPANDVAGRRAITLRGRNDWARHFLVSAALTQIATTRVSDAAGLFKEELDADGGSGFSFGDLLADRAGTRFGEIATRDEETAQRLQALLAGAGIDALMPNGSDLPEDLQDEALRARFGGVGGNGYATVIADIEARLDGCAAYAL